MESHGKVMENEVPGLWQPWTYYSWNDPGLPQSGKSQGKKYFFKIMEKSWKFVTSQ